MDDETVERAEAGEVPEAEPASLAGIWKCPRCGTQIQVIVVPQERLPLDSFVCVCGTTMAPGEARE